MLPPGSGIILPKPGDIFKCWRTPIATLDVSSVQESRVASAWNCGRYDWKLIEKLGTRAVCNSLIAWAERLLAGRRGDFVAILNAN